MLKKIVEIIAWANINLKMKVLLLFCLAVVPLSVLVAGEHATRGEMSNILALWAGLSILLLLPVARLCSYLVALRPMQELNELCLEMKNGNLDPFESLPAEPVDSDAMQMLKHNMFWMGHVLGNRQRELLASSKVLQEAQSQLRESIEYAGRIQQAFLPAQEELGEFFSDYFLLWEQRDGVGGDSYWFKHTQHGCFIGVIDCTGHGVPGAFMTLIVQSLFERLTVQQYEGDPAGVLAKMNVAIKKALSSHDSGNRPDDGMDCTLMYISEDRQTMVFAGARNSLFVLDTAGNVQELKGDRCGVGNERSPAEYVFTNHAIPLEEGMRFYSLTDGFIDQIGGPSHLPFGKKRFVRFITEQVVPLHEQKQPLEHLLRTYQHTENRRDDILVLGFTL